MGAVLASSVPVYFTDSESIFLLPSMIVLGAVGGMAWAAIAAFLKVRFNANEILVTLMLSSVALQILYYLLLGPWKDPMGFNFPQTVMFQDAALFPPIIFGFRLNYSLIIPLVFTVFVWIYMERRFGGFQLVVGGLAPNAAIYAGYSSSGAVWKNLLIAGFASGVAGMRSGRPYWATTTLCHFRLWLFSDHCRLPWGVTSCRHTFRSLLFVCHPHQRRLCARDRGPTN